MGKFPWGKQFFVRSSQSVGHPMVQNHMHNISPPMDPTPIESNQTLIIYSLNAVLSSHPCLDFPNGFFLSDPLTKILQAHLISTTDTTCSPHLFLNLMQSTHYQAPY